MNRINNQLLQGICAEHERKGFHVDSRLIKELNHGDIFSLVLDDADSFFSLIWQEIDASRLLTPQRQARTLKDVASRFVGGKYSFEDLAKCQELPTQQHQSAWFEKCLPISKNFSYDKFGFITVVPANDSEQRQSPTGTFYIFDGAHKTLVLSVLLITNQIRYKPIQAVLLIPRR
jgi:hypothetical protein